MKLLPLFGSVLLATTAAQPAFAQETVSFRYADITPWVENMETRQIYYGNAMPMKLCAENGHVIVSTFTYGMSIGKGFHLKSGQCIFTAANTISLRPSPGTLTMTALTNVNLAPAGRRK
jgi:hypothetical protein